MTFALLSSISEVFNCVSGDDSPNLMKVGSIIYSRLSSSRLPRKALMDVSGRSLIDRVIDATLRIDSDVTVLATSDQSSDDELSKVATARQIVVMRGSLNNVASRTIETIYQHDLDYFIRINGDSPILPWRSINAELSNLKAGSQIDLITNLVPRTFPYGFSVEIVRSQVLIDNYEFFTSEHQEHITKYFYEKLEKFDVKKICSKEELRSDDFCSLTVDDDATLLNVTKLFGQYPDIQDYTETELLSICKRFPFNDYKL